MFAPLFPFPEAVQFCTSIILMWHLAFSSNACHIRTDIVEQFSALLHCQHRVVTPPGTKALNQQALSWRDPPVRWRLYADVRWDQLPRIHDVVGIQRSLYSFHRPEWLDAQLLLQVLPTNKSIHQQWSDIIPVTNTEMMSYHKAINKQIWLKEWRVWKLYASNVPFKWYL